MTMPAFRTLLRGAIDYAGLFPPAQLSMAEAVENYAGYLRGGEAWALGRFVVPASRLDEFGRAAVGHLPTDGAGEPWRLSVLLAADADPGPLVAFNAAHANAALADTVEVKASLPEEVAAAGALARTMVTYVEIPTHEDPSRMVDAVRAVGARAKIRTGGTTADAFPSATDVLRFMKACLAAGVPFKATAGLHHPLRAEYALTYAKDAPRGTMYGYLNVFLTAAWLAAGLPDEAALALLEERDPSAFALEDEGVRWNDRVLTGTELARARERVIMGFGSCSFREPLDDAKDLGLGEGPGTGDRGPG
jgi:hypothetical protein